MKIFQKVRNWRNWILSVPRVSVCREKKTPWLRQYQSYISNWYVNGKVFTSTTTWEPKNLIFFWKRFEIEFDLYFDLCWRAKIIQVGLNMHLYVDIGDASSSLWGSTSSLSILLSRILCKLSILVLLGCILETISKYWDMRRDNERVQMIFSWANPLTMSVCLFPPQHKIGKPPTLSSYYSSSRVIYQRKGVIDCYKTIEHYLQVALYF